MRSVRHCAPLRAAQGDLEKVGLVEGLPSAARCILQNVRHTAGQIPGRIEVRRLMWHEAHAYLIVFGEPIFVEECRVRKFRRFRVQGSGFRV